MNLQHQAKIEKLEGKNYMYRTTNYKFTGHTVVGGKVIFSTDRKPLVVEAGDIGKFLSELLPTMPPETSVVSAVGNSPISPTIVSQLTETLLSSLKAIDSASGDDLTLELKKAGGKTKIANTLMGVARITIMAQKIKE